jgi:hypothetical protein
MTGSPTPKYNEAFGSALLQVGEDGNILPAGDLVSPEVGTGWIAVSHEWRKALIWESSNRVVVIDFDKAAAVKKCQPPLGAGGSLIEQWLVDVPGRGPTFAVYLAGDQAGQTRVQGMIMDVSVPCNESFVALAPTDIRYMVAHGTSGVEDIGSDEGTYVAIDENGRVSKRVMDTTVLFDYEIPAVLRKGMDTTFSRIVINTSQVSVLESGGKTGKPRFWAFRKRDKTWHQIPVRSENLCLQSFGRFVAVVESRAKGDQIEEPALQSSAPAKTSYIQESAGRAEWKKTRSPMGPSMLSRVDDKRAVYPGRLHLYDVNNERVYTIVTNQVTVRFSWLSMMSFITAPATACTRHQSRKKVSEPRACWPLRRQYVMRTGRSSNSKKTTRNSGKLNEGSNHMKRRLCNKISICVALCLSFAVRGFGQQAVLLPVDHPEVYSSFFFFVEDFSAWLDARAVKTPANKTKLMESAARYLKVDVSELPKVTARCRSVAATLRQTSSDRQKYWEGETQNNVVDPISWTKKGSFLRWSAALKIKESQCPRSAKVIHPV